MAVSGGIGRGNGHASQIAAPDKDKTVVFGIKKLDSRDAIPVKLSELPVAVTPEKHSQCKNKF